MCCPLNNSHQHNQRVYSNSAYTNSKKLDESNPREIVAKLQSCRLSQLVAPEMNLHFNTRKTRCLLSEEVVEI